MIICDFNYLLQYSLRNATFLNLNALATLELWNSYNLEDESKYYKSCNFKVRINYDKYITIFISLMKPGNSS